MDQDVGRSPSRRRTWSRGLPSDRDRTAAAVDRGWTSARSFPATGSRPRFAACRFLLLPCPPAWRALLWSSCCPVSTRTSLIGKSSHPGLNFFPGVSLPRLGSSGRRDFHRLGNRCGPGKRRGDPASRPGGSSQGLGAAPRSAWKCRLPPGGGRASNGGGSPAAEHHHRPSRPSETPWTTVPPMVLSVPTTGLPAPPEVRVWPRSWFVGWARPCSHSPR